MNKLKFIVVFMFLANSYLLSNTLNEETMSIEKIAERDMKNYTTLLIDKKSLKDYYQLNNFKPYWTNEQGIKNISFTLLEQIKNDPVLKPNITKTFKLDEVLQTIDSINKSESKIIKDIIKAEFMLTELYDKYTNYLIKGSVNWKAFQEKLQEIERDSEIKAHWDRYDINKDSKQLLKLAIVQNDLSIVFNELNFNYPNAKKLIDSINELETILQNGDYAKLPEIKSLRIGDQSEVVKVLRKRLSQSKDLTKTCENTLSSENLITNNITTNHPNNQQIEESSAIQNIQTPISCEEIFDEDLKNAVISFQKSHGLYADGIVGLQTQVFLNMSAKDKIEKIRLNLDRMRWLPKDFGEKYLIINIPDYRLKLIENNDIKLNMAVVVGERKHPTPIFSDKMSYIVLNPKWNIPESIAKKEILPKLMKDPNYLASKGIDIYQGWHPESEKIETTEILNTIILEDIESVPNFRFTQGPGSENPLGRMKFMFPNKHAVYLHDTPAKSLFANARRAYSHGCIRLSKPSLLLETIANDDKNLNLDKINEILKEPNEKAISLDKKIPVHIIYLTSWVNEEGILQFREDIYNYDNIQKKLMF